MLYVKDELEGLGLTTLESEQVGLQRLEKLETFPRSIYYSYDVNIPL